MPITLTKTDAPKQTPMQIVKSRINGAASRKRGDDGRYEIVDRDFRRIGDPSATPAGAWKNAAVDVTWMDAKVEQAKEFNAMANLTREQARSKRRAARRVARKMRKINYQKAS